MNSSPSSIGSRVRRPAVFKAAVGLLGLSAIAYGIVEITGEGQAGPLAETGVPVLALIFAAIVVWVLLRGRHARQSALGSAIAMAVPQFAWVHGAEGLISLAVALVASFAGVLLLYRPGSSSYIAAMEAQIAAAQVRWLFEERGRDGGRLHTVSGIAAILRMSNTAVYEHLTPDQRQQVQRPPGDM